MCFAVYLQVEELIGQHSQLPERSGAIWSRRLTQIFIDSVNVMKLDSSLGDRFAWIIRQPVNEEVLSREADTWIQREDPDLVVQDASMIVLQPRQEF